MVRRPRDRAGGSPVRARARARAAARLAREHALMVEAVEVADGAIAIFDTDDRLIACNARYREMYERGFAALGTAQSLRYDDLLRATMRGALPERDLEAMVAERVAAHRAADGTARECFYQGKGWFRVSRTRTGGGAIVVLAADITALKESQAGLARAREKAEAALDARGRFVATLCHELRNPLNAMLGLAEMLARETGRSERLSAIEAAGCEMVAILDDVLDHARIDRGALQVAPTAFDVAALVAELAALYGPWAAQGGVGFETDTTALEVPCIVADRRLIYQIAGNFLANAVKFTAEGRIRLGAATRPDGDGVALVLAVDDTGPGMTRAQVKRLFRDFAQLPEGERAAVRGSGLGLSIARARAEAMGGRVEVSSEPGRGSSFRLRLPVAPAPDPDPPGAPPGPGPVAGPVTVLIADDNRINRMVLRGLLAPMNVRLAEAGNGAEAVTVAERRQFDLILMDSEMPELDGLAATRAIRTGEVVTGAPPARIVSISASAAPGFARDCAAAGVDSCLAKPIAVAALAAEVAAARAALAARPPPRPGRRRRRARGHQ